MIPEVDIGSLRGRAPCIRMKFKYTLFKETKEITEDTCINGMYRRLLCIIYMCKHGEVCGISIFVY